jgi:hypothetical protein
MGKNLVQKIFEAHLISGKLEPHEDIAITIDQTPQINQIKKRIYDAKHPQK